ncbi:MAG: hypothetical protein HYZ50_15225 [Deltaproteobacteria bacterium]|nr:hypothetical protein [Deltaproteobacteria bacterium]
MTRRQIRRIRRQIEKLRGDAEFGAPQKRTQKIDDAIRQLRMTMARLDDKLRALCESFRVEFEKWTGYSAADILTRPEIHPEAHRKAQLYKAGTLACTAFEAALAAFICTMIGLPWWAGVVGAILLVVIFHACFNLAFDIPEEPTKTYANLRRYLLVPALVIFAVAILSMLLGRSVPAHWVLEYEEVFNVGLWATSVSLVLLGGALWAAAHIQGWSGQISGEYEAIEGLRDEASRAIDELKVRLGGLKTPASKRGNGIDAVSDEDTTSDDSVGNKSSPTTTVPSENLANLPNGAALALIVVLSWTVAPALAQDQCPSLDLYLDHSGSLSEAPFIDTMRTLSRQLPEIVEKTKACELRVIPWSESAPTVAPTKTIELPRFEMPQPPPLREPTEMCKLFPKCLEEKEKKERQEREEREKAALQEYKDRLKEALESLKEDSLLPSANGSRPRCSDLNGILGRIATSTTDRPRLALLISDGHQTCGNGKGKTKRLESVHKPTAPIELAVILVPEKGKDSGQFEIRQNELRQAVSWARVYLSHQNDFDDMFSPRQAESGLRQH